MKTTVLALSVGLLLAAMACSPISKQAKVDMARPVNCATAEQDIATLRHEKASIEKQFLNGVMAVTPAGAAIGIVTLTEKDKLEVAIGEYNHKLSRKIEEIQNTCGIK